MMPSKAASSLPAPELVPTAAAAATMFETRSAALGSMMGCDGIPLPPSAGVEAEVEAEPERLGCIRAPCWRGGEAKETGLLVCDVIDAPKPDFASLREVEDDCCCCTAKGDDMFARSSRGEARMMLSSLQAVEDEEEVVYIYNICNIL